MVMQIMPYFFFSLYLAVYIFGVSGYSLGVDGGGVGWEQWVWQDKTSGEGGRRRQTDYSTVR